MNRNERRRFNRLSAKIVADLTRKIRASKQADLEEYLKTVASLSEAKPVRKFKTVNVWRMPKIGGRK